MALTRPRYSQIYDTDYKQSVRLATTTDVGNLAVTGSTVDEVDGVTVDVGDRILVKDQSSAAQNGIYEVLVVGTGSNGTWRRALDADANDKVTSGLTTVVTAGSLNSNKTFRLTTADPITLGTTALTFIDPNATAPAGGANTSVQFNDAGTLSGDVTGFAYFKGNDTVRVGNVKSFGAVFSDFYFTANGGPIYANTEVQTFLDNEYFYGITANIIPYSNNFATLGNVGRQWAEVWITNSGLYVDNQAIGISGNTITINGQQIIAAGTYSNSNVAAYLTSYTGNISAGNITATNYYFANGQNIFDNINNALTSLTSNAAAQAGDLGNLYANAATQAGELTSLLANAAAQAGDLGTLYANAAAQAGDIATLYANAALQSGNLAFIISDINTLFANAGAQAGDITTLFANAAVQAGLIAAAEGNITTANTAMKGYVDSLSYSSISNGLSNVAILASGGNITANVNGSLAATINVTTAQFTGNVIGKKFVWTDSSGNLYLGYNAGTSASGRDMIAIGDNAGYYTSSSTQFAVAIGKNAGSMGLGSFSVTVGSNSTSGGDNSVVLGYGVSTYSANSIVINATGGYFSPSTEGLFVQPITANASPGNLLYYNTTTKEITYGVSFASDIATLNSNAAVQAGAISSLEANAASQAGAISSLEANAASQAGAISSLEANAASQAGAISSLEANAAVQAGELATLTANAAVQAGDIATLSANAAAQAGDISNLYTIKANLAGATFTGNISAPYFLGNVTASTDTGITMGGKIVATVDDAVALAIALG